MHTDQQMAPVTQAATTAPVLLLTLSEAVLSLSLREAREQFEREYLRAHLERCGGRIKLLSTAVDMERTHLYRKLRDLGIPMKPKLAPVVDAATEEKADEQVVEV